MAKKTVTRNDFRNAVTAELDELIAAGWTYDDARRSVALVDVARRLGVTAAALRGALARNHWGRVVSDPSDGSETVVL